MESDFKHNCSIVADYSIMNLLQPIVAEMGSGCRLRMGWELGEEPLSQAGGRTRRERVLKSLSIWIGIAVSMGNNTLNDDDMRLFDEEKGLSMELWWFRKRRRRLTDHEPSTTQQTLGQEYGKM